MNTFQRYRFAILVNGVIQVKLIVPVVACVGGGSNSIGMFADFMDDKDVDLIGVEAGGLGIETGKHGRR